MAIGTEVLITLITINIAVLTGFGAVIWAAYRSSTGVRVSLHGENGDKGFIEQTQENHEAMVQRQHEMRVQIRLLERLLSESVYAIKALCEELEDQTEAEVHLDRLERIKDKTEDRWRSDDPERSD